MQRFAPENFHAVDTVMTEFPKSGIGESTISTSTHGRISRALSRRQSTMHRADSVSAILESLESKMMPSGTTADPQMHTETYTDHQMLSFAGLPNGTYPKNQWHVFSLQDGTKIKTFNDEADVIVENGTIRTQKSNGESSWIWVGFQDGAARTVSALDMRFDPNSGGSAQPKISFGSNDNDQQRLALSGSGLFPINQLMTRAVIETFEHRGTAIAGIELAVVKTREVASVSQNTIQTIEEVVSNQIVTEPQMETYTEHKFLSFSNVPDGTYAKGIFHVVNLTPEIKIRLYSDDTFTVSGGVITPSIGSGNDWIHLSLADGQSPISVSSVRVRYNPSGGIAQGTLNVLSDNETNTVTQISEQGDIPVQGPIKRILMTLERHEGALMGMTIDSLKTREVALVSQSPSEDITEPIAPEVAPSAPLLRAVGIQGSNITLAVSSPMIGANTVMFAGLQNDGLFTNTVIEGTTDGSVTPVSLGMNAANPTGDYSITLVGGPERKTLSSIRVHWDYDTKKLSLCSGTTLWECSEAQGKAVNSQMQEVLALANNPTTGIGVLAAMQQESLIDGLKSLPSPACSMAPDFEASFWNAHPEWKDDAMHETAMRQFNTQTSQYTVTQIYENIVRQRNDSMAILRDAYSRFHSMLGDLLQKGVTVLSEVRSGGNEPDIRRNFAILVDQAATSLPMYQLSSIGIRLPDANTLLEEVKAVWIVKCEEMIELKAGETQIAAQQTYREQLVANGFVQAADGTMVAATDPRATTGLVYRTDSEGRLTILPQEEVLNTSMETAPGTFVVDIFNTQTQLSEEHLYFLLGGGKELTSPLHLTVQPKKSSLIDFHIDEEKMVSFGVPGIFGRNLTLRISGSGLGDTSYASEKAGTTGESISLRLPKGDYKLVVQDSTDYSDLVHAPLADEQFPVSVETNIKPYHSAKIEGLISIEGNEKVMPVSMSVAEFDAAGKRITDYENGGVHKLDPSKPLWVIGHGMNSSENEIKISELTKSLSQYSLRDNFQIVTVDWSKAAIDNTMTGRDVIWTPAVGKWLGQQFLAAGFSPEQISGIGHSHSAYVLDAMGREFMKERPGHQMNTLIALDPAGNVPLWTGFDHTKINFSEVSQKSIALEIALMVDSDLLAATADISFKVDSPSTINPIVEHGLGMTTFTTILNHEFIHSDIFSQYVGFEELQTLSDDDISQYNLNQYDGKAEGKITVSVDWIQRDGQAYPMATPSDLRFKRVESAIETIIPFNSI